MNGSFFGCFFSLAAFTAKHVCWSLHFLSLVLFHICLCRFLKHRNTFDFSIGSPPDWLGHGGRCLLRRTRVADAERKVHTYEPLCRQLEDSTDQSRRTTAESTKWKLSAFTEWVQVCQLSFQFTLLTQTFLHSKRSGQIAEWHFAARKQVAGKCQSWARSTVGARKGQSCSSQRNHQQYWIVQLAKSGVHT